jgi:hypothetical protein
MMTKTNVVDVVDVAQVLVQVAQVVRQVQLAVVQVAQQVQVVAQVVAVLAQVAAVNINATTQQLYNTSKASIMGLSINLHLTILIKKRYKK